MKLTLDDNEIPEHVRVPNPPSELADSQDQLEQVQARFERRRIKLADKDRQSLETELQRMIEDWVDSRSGLAFKLKERNDLFEGVSTITDYPWPGASSVDIPLPKIKTREIASTINRTTMRPIPFLMTRYAGPDALYESSKSFTKDLENFVEDKIKNDTNVHSTLKESVPPILRDGTVPVQVIWETEYETVRDFKTYTNPAEFAKDYASAKEAGVSTEKYNEINRRLSKGGTYEVEYEYEVATYDGPKAYMVNLIDFVHWPTFIPKIPDLKVHGKRVWYTDYQLWNKVDQGQFDEADVGKLVKTSGNEHNDDSIIIDRDEIDGISRSTDKKNAQEFEFFELIWKGMLTEADKKNRTVRKYLIYYHHVTQTIFRVETYPIRKGRSPYFMLRIIPRDNRLLGVSLMDDIADLCLEINTIHRQRINSRTITHVPSFKAKDSVKFLFDPSRRDLRFKPGVTFYVGNMDDIEQFDIRPVDLSGSIDDEMLLFQLVDMVTGSSSGLSGQSNPIDPRAPARKQQELLRQSTNRIDDYVQNLLPEFQDIGAYIVDLYYQFGPERIKYYVSQDDGQIVEREMERAKLFNPNVTFKVQGVSVFASPEEEYSRAVEIDNLLGMNPLTAQNPRVRKNSLERVLKAGRVQDEMNLLPNDQETGAVTQQPNPVDPTKPAGSGNGLIPTLDDKEAQMQAALQAQKLASKVSDSAEKNDQKLTLELTKAVVNGQGQDSGVNGGA